MSEVMRWKLKGFLPGVEGMCKAVMRPEVVMASDFDAAQSELAALREELAEIKESLAYRGSLLGSIQQRAEAAERRNAELIELLLSGRKVVSDAIGLVEEWADVLRKRMGAHCSAVDAALKPTESGASE